MSRKRQSALLLTVLVSQLLVGVHAGTHPPTIQLDCEICSAYGDPLEDLAPGEPSPPDTKWKRVLVVCSAPGPAGPRILSACPRGPPDRA